MLDSYLREMSIYVSQDIAKRYHVYLQFVTYISNISLIIKQKVCFMISLWFFHLQSLLLP